MVLGVQFMSKISRQANQIKFALSRRFGLMNGRNHPRNTVIAKHCRYLDPSLVSAGANSILIEYWNKHGDGSIHKSSTKSRVVKSPQEWRLSKSLAKPLKDYKKASVAFFEGRAWKELRYKALQVCGGKCQACGASARDGSILHVDHVKPRYKFPKLELELSNLQVLCADCNIGKGAWDETDWRNEQEREMLAHMRDITGPH